MVEYTAIFPSHSAAMHDRLKHLHHVSWLSQSSLLTHWQSVCKFPQILWRWSCDCLAGGARERASWVLDCVGAVQSSYSHVAKGMSAHWLWGWMSAVKGLGGPQCLPTGQGNFEATKVYKAGWGSPECTGFLQAGWCYFLCLNLSQQQHQNRMQTRSQTGSRVNQYANFSRCFGSDIQTPTTFKSQSKQGCWPNSE